ncbi:MAG: Ribosomal large subunit pseudouridine synthase B (EC [uncultured Thiotrichaceae bacterium]|uniref:Pseudouridine synthase n=1 Tax=uncultured Thiotrichaceae bacterium TaxID=298394 RepID=A0A6S6SAK5_9GAMM|nr:MAG: Ribosomal large subunit pseudouridine synthase B (EC [uncultured Thiotrichaceae bacterium]
MEERIQKILARAGYGSRREVESWIKKGDITVNGQTATLGQKITESAKVVLRGQKLRLSTKLKTTPRVLMYHKPVGQICTRDDPERRETVFDKLPKLSSGRWISIGRLDINTDGLLLFSNDGDLANKLMHPSSEVEREYAVRILGKVDPDMLKRMRDGVELEDGKASFDTIKFKGGEGANQWYHVTLKEGRNREVRRLWESQGLTVSRLRRVRYGDIELDRRLRAGNYEDMPARRMRKLYESVGLSCEQEDSPTPKKRSNNENKKLNPWNKRKRR